MDTKLIMAIVSITLALVFYTVGVWSEHIKKKLKPVHLIMFLLGLVFDTAGTSIMTTLTGNNSAGVVNIHSITGALAIGLMVVHAAWALVVLIRVTIIIRTRQNAVLKRYLSLSLLPCVSKAAISRQQISSLLQAFLMLCSLSCADLVLIKAQNTGILAVCRVF